MHSPASQVLNCGPKNYPRSRSHRGVSFSSFYFVLCYWLAHCSVCVASSLETSASIFCAFIHAKVFFNSIFKWSYMDVKCLKWILQFQPNFMSGQSSMLPFVSFCFVYTIYADAIALDHKMASRCSTLRIWFWWNLPGISQIYTSVIWVLSTHHAAHNDQNVSNLHYRHALSSKTLQIFNFTWHHSQYSTYALM